jgi:hypothetical protein
MSLPLDRTILSSKDIAIELALASQTFRYCDARRVNGYCLDLKLARLLLIHMSRVPTSLPRMATSVDEPYNQSTVYEFITIS